MGNATAFHLHHHQRVGIFYAQSGTVCCSHNTIKMKINCMCVEKTSTSIKTIYENMSFPFRLRYFFGGRKHCVVCTQNKDGTELI